MGNSSLRPVLAADSANFQADLPKFILQAKIGNGKLMKTYLMRCGSNSVVVKVYMSYPDEELRTYAAELTRIWCNISPSKFPNLLPYQLWMKSVSRQPKSNIVPIYIIRQYLYSNLHDRLSTRPFLNETEKMWILYQIFRCLETCHDLNIMHGDIKPENVLCTTSNWIVLTDFAAFKPVNVPDDNPSDFQYFFDSMGRPRCYIAPERFYNKSRMEAKQWGYVGVNTGEKNSLTSTTNSNLNLNLNSNLNSNKRSSTVSSSSPLSSFEKNENALLTDSVFGDAAAAIRFQNTGPGSSNSDTDKCSGKKNQNQNAGTTADMINQGRRDRDLLINKDNSFNEKLHTVINTGMDVFSLGCTIAEVLFISILIILSTDYFNFNRIKYCLF